MTVFDAGKAADQPFSETIAKDCNYVDVDDDDGDLNAVMYKHEDFEGVDPIALMEGTKLLSWQHAKQMY